MKCLGLVLFFGFGISTGYAATDTFECTYSKYAAYDDGKIKIESSPLHLKFLMDKEADKSYLIGSNGSTQTVHIKNDGGITFIEVTGTGNVTTTTITHELKSVHSRNTIISIREVELIPSQYYGSCILK